MTKTPALLASLVATILSSASFSLAAEKKPAAKPTPTATPAATPAEPEKVYLPTELEALKPLAGQKITMEGKIERYGESKSKTVSYLNFTQNYRDSVALVFFAGKGGAAFPKEKLMEWLGKRVRATGKLGEFNGNLQIEIEKPEQLQELPEAAEPAK